MIIDKIGISELDLDGPPETPGSYLFWTSEEGLVLFEITDEDLDDFDSNFDDLYWYLKGYSIQAYIKQEELIELI